MADGDQERARLFVVEDDERTREELARILGKHREFEVSTFARPSEALAAASQRAPEMALLDLRLPEMDGLALLERLREHSQDLMAIIMTGYGDAATPRQAREHGAVDFVEKPLDLPYLLVSLRQQAREALLRKGLRAGAELFGRMLELLPDGILVADVKGRILFANGQGRRLWEEGLKDPGTRVTHNGRVFILERTESGDRVLWHWQDLTQALEVERLAGYREMSRLLAHEVRNPLTPMRLWLQELTAMDAGDPEYAKASREAQRVLLQQVDRMSALVERFRALGQDLPFAAVPVDAGKVAAELARDHGPLRGSGRRRGGLGCAPGARGAGRRRRSLPHPLQPGAERRGGVRRRRTERAYPGRGLGAERGAGGPRPGGWAAPRGGLGALHALPDHQGGRDGPGTPGLP